MRAVLALLALLAARSPGQSVTATIVLPPPDPAFNFPFGAAVTPEGTFVVVPLSGPVGAPNWKVAILDAAQERLLFRVPAGRFPEDAAIVADPADPWRAREVYVTNSSDGTVTVLDGAFQPVATIPLGPGTYPFGVAASPDGRRVYVTTKSSHSGPVFVLDADPASPTHRTVIEVLAVPGFHGRPALHGAGRLAVPHALPDFQHPGNPSRAYPQYATVRVTILDPANPSDRRAVTLASSSPGYPSAEDIGVTDEGMALVTTYGPDGRVHLLDLVARGHLGSIDVSSWLPGATFLHGAGVSPQGHLALVTSLNSDSVVLIDLLQRAPIARIRLPAGAVSGNEAVFLPDGSKAFVTMQDGPRVHVISGFPRPVFRLATDRPDPPPGGSFSLSLRGGEARRPWLVAFSLTGKGPTPIGPLSVDLSPPILPLADGTLDPAGRTALAPVRLPPEPWLRNVTIHLQALTQDLDAGLRLSTPLSITIR